MFAQLPLFPHGNTVLQVLMFNPGFPWYLSTTRIVGATPVLVELHGPDFAPDMEEVREHVVAHMANKVEFQLTPGPK